MASGKLDLGPLRRLLSALRKVTRMDLEDDVVRDAAVKRFEFTYEMSWKMMRRHLQWAGAQDLDNVPRRELFRLAARASLIDDPTRWFADHEARNLTSHTYDEVSARKVTALLGAFVKDTATLMRRLKEHHA